MILELKSQGLSCQLIANTLNQKNLPAKLGGKWNKSAVQNIIERHRKEEKCKQ